MPRGSPFTAPRGRTWHLGLVGGHLFASDDSDRRSRLPSSGNRQRTEEYVVIPRHEALRLDQERKVNTRGDDLQTRFLLGAIQIGLATVFVPSVTVILILVGLYTIAEWMILRVGDMIRCLRRHSTANPFHWVRDLLRMTTVR
jgi:hypothetical protein